MDIEQLLAVAYGKRGDWSAPRLRTALDTIVRAMDVAELEWDHDSSEEWAQINYSKTECVILRVDASFGIAMPQVAPVVLAADPIVTWVFVDDLYAPVLSASDGVLTRLFGRDVMPTLNAEAFSAMDLWFATD